MKKALIGTCMLAVACMLCGSAFAVAGVPHAPISATSACSNYAGPGVFNPMTTPYGAPATATVAGSIPIFSLLPNFDNAVTSWPAPGNYDFCAAFDTVACALGTLSGFSTDILTYQSLFFCSTDINKLNPDPGAPLPVMANGIPDGEFELGLLAGILNNPANPHYAQVNTAFEANYNYVRVVITTALANIPLKLDLRASLPALAGPYVHTGLSMILAGYATEGDADTLGALDALLGALSAIGITPPPGGIGSVTTGLPGILGPGGDADGDGFTNRAEYNYFKTQGAAVTIAAQLDANTTPPATVPKVEILGAGTVEEGAALDLRAVVLNTTAASYAWSKNGAPLAGETASSLVIPVLALSDSGNYVCTITTAEKAAGELVSSNSAKVTVVPAGTLPIAGGLGLALLAGACALGGVGSIRRRK